MADAQNCDTREACYAGGAWGRTAVATKQSKTDPRPLALGGRTWWCETTASRAGCANASNPRTFARVVVADHIDLPTISAGARIGPTPVECSCSSESDESVESDGGASLPAGSSSVDSPIWASMADAGAGAASSAQGSPWKTLAARIAGITAQLVIGMRHCIILWRIIARPVGSASPIDRPRKYGNPVIFYRLPPLTNASLAASQHLHRGATSYNIVALRRPISDLRKS